MTEFDRIWVYLSASPLTGLTMTLVAYGLAVRLYRRLNRPIILHPVITAIAALMTFLTVTNMPYQDYFEGAQFIHFLLGPATVALAVPIYQQFAHLRTLWLPALVALLVGVTVGGASSIGLAHLFGASQQVQWSIAPKSVTVPIAMGISEKIGGLPSMTAALVVITGIIGAVIGLAWLRLFGIRDERIKGFALGLTAHGIGTARAFQESEIMGAFSGLAMALSALITALILPWLVIHVYAIF